MKSSSLIGLDLATDKTPQTSPTKGQRKLKFNDTVEVYYYPENKEQHDHHKLDSDSDEDLLDCEESISGNDIPTLSVEEA